ncbi:MAG: hypothetical protein Q9220_002192 [cf. Caloplaca sp. 1 TL-2023]
MAVPWSEWPSFLHRQLLLTPSIRPSTKFSNQTIIITGSNTGLGLSAAYHFARLGASHIILAVRDLAKGASASETISRSLSSSQKEIKYKKNETTTISVWHLDLRSYESVKQFAARVEEECERVDVVCQNAGIATGKWEIWEQDEGTITVNVISAFLLALLLLPKMKVTASKFNTRPVMTFTGSEARNSNEIFKTLSDPAKSSLAERYFCSKLLQIYCVRALASLTTAQSPSSSYPITINIVNPGFCHSELGREAGWQLYIMGLFLARTAEVGSRTIVAAAAMGGEQYHGEYISDGKVEGLGALVVGKEGKEVERRVWREVVEKLEAVAPGIMGNIRD